jgi:hypothetical protein
MGNENFKNWCEGGFENPEMDFIDYSEVPDVFDISKLKSVEG